MSMQKPNMFVGECIYKNIVDIFTNIEYNKDR